MDPRSRFSTNQAGNIDGYVIQHGPQDALHMAAQYNDVEAVTRILGFDPAALNRPHSVQGTAPICWSIESSSHDATQLLLYSGAQLMPVYAYHEQYYPVSFLPDDISSYTPVEHAVFNHTSAIIDFYFGKYNELPPFLLCVLMQGIIALGRKQKKDFDRYNHLISLYQHMKQINFQPELKHNYLLCNLLGIRSIAESHDFPPINTNEGVAARNEGVKELKTLVEMIPSTYINPNLSYIIFEYACEKIGSDIAGHEFLFECAFRCSLQYDIFYQTAIVLKHCSYLLNLDTDEDDFDTALDSISNLIYPTIINIAVIPFKNHALAKLFASTATNILEILDDSNELVITLFSEAVKLDNDADDINLYNRAILLLRADNSIEDDNVDLLDANNYLEQMNELPLPVINNPESDRYTSYINCIIDKATGIIKKMTSEISDLYEQHILEDIRAEMPAQFEIIEECIKVLLAHTPHDTSISLKVSKAFYDINSFLLNVKWKFKARSHDFEIASIISDFLRRMADLTQLDYVRLYHADFLFEHLEYHESLENYIKLAHSYLNDNHNALFVQVLANISTIQSYFEDQAIADSLTQLIEFSKSWIPLNTPHLFFLLMRQSLKMPQDKWVLELYLGFAEKIQNAIMMTDSDAPLLVYGFCFHDAHEKLFFSEHYAEIKDEALRFLHSPSIVQLPSASPTFFARTPSASSHNDEKMQDTFNNMRLE